LNLYIDGDALPNILKPILWRAIARLGLATFIVSNRLVTIGKSTYITSLTVPADTDAADHRIVEMVRENDLVITADIPLADRVITKKAYAIDHRGKLFSENNIKQSLAIRNLMQDIRDSGGMTKGPAPFSQKDAHEFANRLDQFLTRHRIN
jgi:uncharacterized protein YaiI (UPF0178 family)